MIKRRQRPGFTLVEMVTVLMISSGLFLGFIILLIDVAEQMHISWQLREGEEWGHWYTNQFVEKMRNGFDVKWTRQSTPGEAEVWFLTPWDYGRPESLRTPKLYEFEYDYDSEFPHIRIDDRPVQNEFFPPQVLDPDDYFFVDPESFKIYTARRNELPDDQDSVYAAYYMTLEFDLTYRHYSGFLGGRRLYEKVLPFAGSAYVFNDRWPIIKPPDEAE